MREHVYRYDKDVDYGFSAEASMVWRINQVQTGRFFY